MRHLPLFDRIARQRKGGALYWPIAWLTGVGYFGLAVVMIAIATST